MSKYFCKIYNIEDRGVSPILCMAVPTAIDKIKYNLEHLVRVYRYTPDIYRRLITVLEPQPGALNHLRKILTEEWHFTVDDSLMTELGGILGLQN